VCSSRFQIHREVCRCFRRTHVICSLACITSATHHARILLSIVPDHNACAWCTYLCFFYRYDGECYVFPAVFPALWIPDTPPLRGYAFSWFPSYNAEAALSSVLSTLYLAGNSSVCGDCVYSYGDFEARVEYGYFPNGTSCTTWPCPSPPPPPAAVSTYIAPSAQSITLANLLVLTPFYLILAWVVARCFPHDTGVHPPRWGKANRPATSSSPRVSVTTRGVVLDKITKWYGKGKLAVSAVSGRMRHGEVFALLGHNGAGKSTLFSVLSGNLTATAGVGTVYGYDMATQMDEIRRISGICSQEDVLWHELTAAEHVQL
jgi:ABC-type multidrug transport system fused ATPase/permease subunit